MTMAGGKTKCNLYAITIPECQWMYLLVGFQAFQRQHHKMFVTFNFSVLQWILRRSHANLFRRVYAVIAMTEAFVKG